MADFAMYAVRRAGDVRLFTSRWGAPTLAWDVFWGLEPTLELIERLEPVDAWIDYPWCEAAVAVDPGAHAMRVSSSHLKSSLCPVYTELLFESWIRDGIVAELVDTAVDVAALVGLTPGSAAPRVPSRASPDPPRAFDEDVQALRRELLRAEDSKVETHARLLEGMKKAPEGTIFGPGHDLPVPPVVVGGEGGREALFEDIVAAVRSFRERHPPGRTRT